MSTETNPSREVKRRHAEQIGNITVRWNFAQYEVLDLFAHFTGLAPKMAEAVFFALKADSSQRDITIAAAAEFDKADPSSPDGPRLGRRAITALKGLGKFAGERNAAVHTAWAVQYSSDQPPCIVPVRNRPSDPPGTVRDIAAELEATAERIGRIADELMDINAALRGR